MSSGGRRSSGGHRAPRATRPPERSVPKSPAPGRQGSGGRRRLPLPSIKRALRLTALSAFVPGTGHLATGRRYAGWMMIASFATLILAAVLALVAVPHSRLVRIAVEPSSLEFVIAGCCALALIWVLVVFSSWTVSRPERLGTVQKAVGTAVVLALSFGVAAPFAFGARTAYSQLDLLDSVFQDAPPRVVALPDKPVTPNKPAPPFGESGHVLAGRDRVNVLLLGGDGGNNRQGVRTDTMILASIDIATGKTVLISLPRNMQKAQFLPGTPAAAAYPNGFDDLLNSVYTHAEENPAMVPGVVHPGGELIKQTFAYTIGQNIDYFVLVNLAGFKKIVDAFGGVTIDVTSRLPIGGSTDATGKTVEAPSGYLEPGRRKLNGYEALWYGRSRYGSDDYQRMSRQRCLLGAIAAQANPMKVLLNFQKLAAAAKEIIITDIPQSALPELLDLANRGRGAKVTSVTFVRSAKFLPEDPDFAYVQRKVAKAIDQSVAAPGASPDASATASPTGTPDDVAGPVMDGLEASATPAPGAAGGAAQQLDDVCSY